MTHQEKINELADLFEVDAEQLTPERKLDTLNWDSMAILSIIAMLKTKFNKKLPGTEIRQYKTIQDILAVMEP